MITLNKFNYKNHSIEIKKIVEGEKVYVKAFVDNGLKPLINIAIDIETLIDAPKASHYTADGILTEAMNFIEIEIKKLLGD